MYKRNKDKVNISDYLGKENRIMENNMSYYGIDEVMDKIKDIEIKIDKLLGGEKEYTYSNHHTYQNEIAGEKRMASVTMRNDGVWCVEKFIDGTLMERMPLPGKAEIYAENAAENFVLLN
tara:strand:- start:720 stop:1079 length:360 start_codon:yes stop_codon:yes gene_type:complete